jgi:hypothetical protein
MKGMLGCLLKGQTTLCGFGHRDTCSPFEIWLARSPGIGRVLLCSSQSERSSRRELERVRGNIAQQLRITIDSELDDRLSAVSKHSLSQRLLLQNTVPSHTANKSYETPRGKRNFGNRDTSS